MAFDDLEGAEAAGWSPDADDANYSVVVALLKRIEAMRAIVVPTSLTCPQCDVTHVDEGEWSTRPHRTHQCQACGYEWRPYGEVSTCGVAPVCGTFEEVWERTGYQYGRDERENVRLGWELARGEWQP